MNVALVWKNDYPWDIRVQKISETIFHSGHKVHVVARNLEKKKEVDIYHGIYINRLRPLRSNFLNDVFSKPFFANPVWIKKLYETCHKNKIEIIIVRDLPLLLTGILVGKSLGIPVIFDMAENYPALWREVQDDEPQNIINYCMKNPKLAKYIEKIGAKYVDEIIVVVEEAKEYLIKLGVDENKITIVSNTPIKKGDKRCIYRENNKRIKTILYQGYVNKGRGLETLVRSVEEVKKEIKNFKVIIAGDGDNLEYLKRLALSLKVEKYIEFLGWVPHEKIHELTNCCSFGIIPHRSTEHKNTTIPNKLFDFMGYGKPVIVSDAKPLRRIVTEEKCGIIFNTQDKCGLSNAIKELLKDPLKCKTFGENGKMASEKRYNWEIDEKYLLSVINKYNR